MKAVKYLLDTNICIYITKNRPPEVLEKFKTLKRGEVAMSTITYGELRYGAQKSSQSKKINQILERLIKLIPVLPLNNSVATFYGQVRSACEKQGKPIGNNDLWIASHALDLKLTLVTNNEKEFKRVKGLTVENWVK